MWFHVQLESLHDLESIIRDISSKLLFTTVKCCKPYDSTPQHLYASRHMDEWLVEEYVVFINTRHQKVKHLLCQAYQDAELLLKKRKTFRIEVWWNKKVEFNWKWFYGPNSYLLDTVPNQSVKYRVNRQLCRGCYGV